MRRRSHEPCISLFSFQDVMAAIIGMLFVIVLILALDIITSKAGAATTGPDLAPAELEALRRAHRQRAHEVEQVTRELTELAGRIRTVSGGDEGLLEEVKRMQGELRVRYVKLEQLHQQLSAKADQNQRDAQDLTRESAELAEQESKLKERQARLRATRPGARVTYILDPNMEKRQPLLVELSGTQIRVATADGGASAVEFNAADADERLRHFRLWMVSQDTATQYFVLLLKPSGLPAGKRLLEIIKGSGFALGMDLLPEEWVPF